MDSISVVLDKLKQIAYQNMPIKGTYIKTLKQEDIFDEPVQKTTELKRIKVGKENILVPIIKEQEVKPALSDEIVMKLLSRIKDIKSRQILQTYKLQEEVGKTPPLPQLPQDKEEQLRIPTGEETDAAEDPALLKERKTELIKKAKNLETSENYLKFLEEENIIQFQNDLKKNKLSSVLGGFNRSLKLIKDKLSSKDAQQKLIIEQAEKAEMKRIADEEREAKRKAKIEAKLAEQQAALLKQQEEDRLKQAAQNEAALKAAQAKTALELHTSTTQATAVQEDIEAKKKAAKAKELRELEVEHSRAMAEAEIRKKHLTEAQQLFAPVQPQEEPAPVPVAPVAAAEPLFEMVEPAAAVAAPETPSPKKGKKAKTPKLETLERPPPETPSPKKRGPKGKK